MAFSLKKSLCTLSFANYVTGPTFPFAADAFVTRSLLLSLVFQNSRTLSYDFTESDGDLNVCVTRAQCKIHPPEYENHKCHTNSIGGSFLLNQTSPSHHIYLLWQCKS